MEETNKTMGHLQEWHKTTHPPSLAPGDSFQVWRKPYMKSLFETGTTLENSDIDNHNPPVLALIDGIHDKKSQDGVVFYNASAKASEPPVDGNNSQSKPPRNIDQNMDPRKLKRIISNRVSAQKSRMKKLQHVTDMERRVKALEAQIAVLSPQVSAYKNQQHMLQMEQNSLSQRMIALTNNKLIKDAEIEKNKMEVTRLRQLHLKLQQRQLEAHSTMLNWESGGLEQMLNTGLNPSGFGKDVGDMIAEVNNPNQLNVTQQQRPEERLGQSWMDCNNNWEGAAKQNMQNTTSKRHAALMVLQKKLNLNSNFI